MAFTEFACRSGGSNLNAGTRTGNSTVPASGASPLTYASGTWVQSTGVFTAPVGRDPVADGVVAGDFASVYPDAATVTPFVGRVTTRTITTITVSLTAKMGTAPVDGVTNTTLKIGGAWLGPNGASGFPFNVIQNTLTNAAGDKPRVNMMNDANYSITAAMTHTNVGPITFQGFTASYEDLGRAVIDGGTSGTSYLLLNVSAAWIRLIDLTFQNNGATASAGGLTSSANGSDLIRVVVNNVRGVGFTISALRAVECEAYACNQANGSGIAAFTLADRGGSFLRCIAHDNTGSNTVGFNSGSVGGGYYESCIADTNGSDGFAFTGANANTAYINCDAYNNGRDGMRVSVNGQATGAYIENCNFVKNVGWGINGNVTTPTSTMLTIVNCGFGSGSQVNGSGATNLVSSSTETGTVTYASGITPWVDPTNGDFRIVPGRGAVNVGRGTFTETATSYAGTVGYPVIGAAPPLNQQSPPGGQGII